MRVLNPVSIINRPAVSLGIVAFAFAFVSATAADAQIITNGSFETPTAPANNFTTISAGQTTLTGWTIEQGSIDLIGSGFWPASLGVQSLDMDGTGGTVSAGTISQTFSTVVGNVYFVTFDYANNPGASGPVGLAVSAVDSASKVRFSSAVTHSGSTNAAMNYSSFSSTFVADTTQTTLRFASSDASTSQTGIALDNVKVTNGGTAPEPGALILTVMGSLPIGVVVRRARAFK